MYLECVALHLLLYLNCKVFTKNPHFSSFFNFLHKLLNPVRTSGHLFFMNVEKVACRLLFERYGGPSPLATILMLPTQPRQGSVTEYHNKYKQRHFSTQYKYLYQVLLVVFILKLPEVFPWFQGS